MKVCPPFPSLLECGSSLCPVYPCHMCPARLAVAISVIRLTLVACTAVLVCDQLTLMPGLRGGAYMHLTPHHTGIASSHVATRSSVSVVHDILRERAQIHRTVVTVYC